MQRRNKQTLLLVILIFVGIIIGTVIGEMTRGVQYFDWLSYGKEFGISTDNPILIDLGMIRVKFGLMLNITVGGILGIVLAIFTYRKF